MSDQPHAQAVLCQAGFFFFRPGQVVESECVQSRGLLYCETGYGSATVNDESFALAPGTILLLPWNRHVRHRADPKSPMGIVMNHIVPELPVGNEVEFAIAHEADHALFNSPARRDVSDWGWQPAQRTQALRAERHAPIVLLATLCARWYQRRLWREDEARSLAWLIEREIRHLSERNPRVFPNAPPEVGAMANFLVQHLQRPVRMSALAQFLNRSESHIAKVFHRYMGRSPKQYLQEKRIDRARELLHVSNLSIAEVGQAVGIPNPYHFSRMFHRAVGESPSIYRRKNHSI